MIAANDTAPDLTACADVQLSMLIALAVGLLVHRGKSERARASLRNAARAAGLTKGPRRS